jgi:hypothetical protein
MGNALNDTDFFVDHFSLCFRHGFEPHHFNGIPFQVSFLSSLEDFSSGALANSFYKPVVSNLFKDFSHIRI